MSTNSEQMRLDLDDNDWVSKDIYVTQLFSPTAPILESEMFSGRNEEMTKLIDAVFQRGQHAVVFGNRGVGKSSLINTFNIRIMPMAKSAVMFSVQCTSDDDFHDIWERAFEDKTYEGSNNYISDDIDSSVTPHTILKICKKIPVSKRPIFVFDEFDRILDIEAKEKMAETIKLLSDVSPNTTIVLVGIADTIQDLLDHHLSVQRSVRQIELPRMSPAEIKEILVKRLNLLEMTISDSAVKNIIDIAKGMPGYAQLLGLYSAKGAVLRKSLNITDYDVFHSISKCLVDAGSTIKELYADAVQSTHSTSLFEEVLLACALTKQDDYGRFSATDVIAPLEAALERPIKIQDFNRHLVKFTKDERGPVLKRKGAKGNLKYTFIEPMMQSFVLMNGIKNKNVKFIFRDEKPSEIHST